MSDQPSGPPPYPGDGGPTYPGYGGQTQPGYGGQPYPGGQQPYGAPPGASGPVQYPGSGYDGAEPVGGWSGLAIAAFVVGLVVPLLGLLIAVPLAIVAIVKIGSSRLRGKWLAIAGIVLSVLWWVGFIVLVVYVEGQAAHRDSAERIDEAGSIDFGDIRAGDCVVVPGAKGGTVDATELEGVPCDVTHNAEAVSIIGIEGTDYPGEAEIQDQSGSQCPADVADLVGGGNADYQPYPLYPDETLWDDQENHRVVCFLVKPGFSDMTSSVKDSDDQGG